MRASLPESPAGEARRMALLDEVNELESRIIAAEPTTLAGALAQVETLSRWILDASAGTWNDRQVLQARLGGLSERIEALTDVTAA